MDEDTWKSYQASITYQQDEPKPNVTPKPQRPNMLDNDFEVVTTDQDRQGFESGGLKSTLTYNQQYHKDTIAQNKVMINKEGYPVTANIIGIEYNNKIYNVPSYNRKGDFYSEDQAREVFKNDIEAGKIQGYQKEFDGPIENHPANIAARLEHEMMDIDGNNINPNSVAFDKRQGFESGGVSGVVKRVIDFGGEVMGVGEVEQRANEKQAAAIVNQMVAAGTVPKYEYVPVDDYNFPLQGDKSDTFEAVNHGLLSATYGDSIIRRGGLQFKEVAQGFGRPLDSKRDSYNNRVGFKIRETSKTPEEINQQINNRIIRAYEKMGSGEALIPGEDFFLNPNEMEQ
jgi:hypothetical protein